MTRSHSQVELVTLISEAVTATAPGSGALTADSRLIGEGAILDSVGLITLLDSVEEKLEGAVDLAASFMASGTLDASEHPFRTIGSLAQHLHGQLSSAGSAQS